MASPSVPVCAVVCAAAVGDRVGGADGGGTGACHGLLDLRHTALTHESAAGNPAIYIQHCAGHSQASITERYLHAAQVTFPGAAERGENRIFSKTTNQTGG